jgi:hypothetical protein
VRRKTESESSSPPERKGLPRPPEYFTDVRLADDLLADHEKLPGRQWAAWMARRTGTHTYQVCHSADGEFVGFGADLQFRPDEAGNMVPQGRRLNYLRPAQIVPNVLAAVKAGRPVMSEPDLIAAIMLLESEMEREFALEAAGLLTRHEEGQRMLRETEAKVKQLAFDHALSPGRAAPMTEPREVFERKLEELRASPLEGFFDEGEAA